MTFNKLLSVFGDLGPHISFVSVATVAGHFFAANAGRSISANPTFRIAGPGPFDGTVRPSA